jgi:hypothetical protein
MMWTEMNWVSELSNELLNFIAAEAVLHSLLYTHKALNCCDVQVCQEHLCMHCLS